MTNKWFRLPHDFLDDPRIGVLPGTYQLLWIKLLCLASMSDRPGTVSLGDDEICWRLRIEPDKWEGLQQALAMKALIEFDEDDNLLIVDWADKYDPRIPLHRLSNYRQHAEHVYRRDDYACVYCGSTLNLSLDHVLPLSRGGSNGPDNLVTACISCNSSKGDRTPEEWRGRP